MANKNANRKKALEKAKKLIAKKKSNKKKLAYPQGQNPPQSKAYSIANDETQLANRVGYRFTEEGAKKLGKKDSSVKPTTEEIEQYRNKTFKVKGKPNNAGPKGTGDGSYRYLYIERRADKSDLKRKNKLELGGETPDEVLEIKVYVDVYEDDYEYGEGKFVNSYTVDYLKTTKVEAKDLLKYLSHYLYLSDNPNDYVIDEDGRIHTTQLQDDDGNEASESQIERWKQGKEKLYSAHYTILANAIKNRKPNVEELAKATGIQTYADGGYLAKGGGVEDLRKRFEGYTDEELQIFNGDNKETLKYWNRKDAIEDAINSILDEQDSQGEMAKGGKVFDPKNVRDFQEYVFNWYGKGGRAVDDMENNVPATTQEVLKAVSQYITFCNKTHKYWGGGDSMDREIVRDIMSYNRNPKHETYHYESIIDEIKETTILEFGGILEPMIGGVNSDPRFDIYNTTMFAEKGAELPYANGGKTTEPQILISGSYGVYIPNAFVENFDLQEFGISKEDEKEYKEMLSDPQNEGYWDAWDDLMREAKTKDGSYLWHDDDLWLYPDQKYYDVSHYAKGGDTNKRNVFSYFKSKEKNEVDFWKDRGEYNIGEMVEMASDEFEIDEETLEEYAQEYAQEYAKGGEMGCDECDDNDDDDNDKYAKGGKTKYWIQDAIKHKGALRETAKRRGLIEEEEELSMADLKKLEKVGGKTAKRAYLAETLKSFKK